MDKKDFFNEMDKLAAAYPDYPLTPETLAIYFEDLGTLDFRQFSQAVTLHRRQHKWFPKIAEILEAVLTLRNQGRPSAAERWGQLLELASRGAPAPTDVPSVRALSTVGGWDAFQFSPVYDLNFRRKEFERVYGEALAEEDRAALLGIAGPQGQRLEGI